MVFLTANYMLTLISYVFFGLSLIVLALALFARINAGAPALMQVATAVGLVWAGVVIASGMVFNAGLTTVVTLFEQDPVQATTAWLAIDAVTVGLGNGNGEILGGAWTLLVSWSALRTGGLPRFLSLLGVIVGAVGIVSIVPTLHDLRGVFGISQLVWFAWLGVVMLSQTHEYLAVDASGTGVAGHAVHGA